MLSTPAVPEAVQEADRLMLASREQAPDIYIYIYIYLFIYIDIYIIYICVYTYIYMYIHICLFLCYIEGKRAPEAESHFPPW